MSIIKKWCLKQGQHVVVFVKTKSNEITKFLQGVSHATVSRGLPWSHGFMRYTPAIKGPVCLLSAWPLRPLGNRVIYLYHIYWLYYMWCKNKFCVSLILCFLVIAYLVPGTFSTTHLTLIIRLTFYLLRTDTLLFPLFIYLILYTNNFGMLEMLNSLRSHIINYKFL